MAATMSFPAAATDILLRRKRAALRLAVLSSKDRNWILGQLPSDQRIQLNEVLSPLLTLGVRKLLSLRNDVAIENLIDSTADTTGADEGSRESISTSASSRLERASADELTGIFRELPGGCISLVQLRMPSNRRHIASAVYDRFRRMNPAHGGVAEDSGVSDAFVTVLVEVIEARLADSSGKSDHIGAVSRDAD